MGRSTTATIPHYLNQIMYLSMKFLPPISFVSYIFVFDKKTEQKHFFHPKLSW